MIMKIGDIFVGENEKAFIIAEAGVNHNGSLELAKKLVDKAKEAGVDAVKFQTFTSENVVTKSADMAEYQKKNTGKRQTQYEMIKKFELKKDDFRELKKYCDDKKIIFMSTPHSSKEDVDLVAKLSPAIKVGSGDLTNLPFLEYIAKKGKPVILSTGMSNLREVKEAVDTIRKYNKKLILLHCTTNYPTPIEDVNLRAMVTLKKKFNVIVGYSDHTTDVTIPAIAVAMGASVVEKHFTLDKKMEGPDHKSSLEPYELKKMVEKIRIAERAMGSGIKKPTKAEMNIMDLIRKSIVANANIRKGEKIRRDHLIIKRPGTGIVPKYLKKVMGKTAKKDIKKDEIIKWHFLK